MTARRMKGNGTTSQYHGVEHEEIWTCDYYPKYQPVEPVSPKAGEQDAGKRENITKIGKDGFFGISRPKVEAVVAPGSSDASAPTPSAKPSTPSKPKRILPWNKRNLVHTRKFAGGVLRASVNNYHRAREAEKEIYRLTTELETVKAEVRLLDDKLEKSNGQLLEIGRQRDQYKLEFQDMRRMRNNETNVRSNFADTIQTLTKERDTARSELEELKKPKTLWGIKTDAELKAMDEEAAGLTPIVWTPWRVFFAIAVPVTVVVCVGLWAGWWR